MSETPRKEGYACLDLPPDVRITHVHVFDETGSPMAQHNKNVVVTSIRTAIIELLKTTDLEEIRVVDVISHAGIARSSFYRYYDSVDDVVREMEDDFLGACRDTAKHFVASGFTEDGLERGGNAIERIFETIQSNADFYRTIVGPHGDHTFEGRQEDLAREFYGSKLFFEGIVPKDADLRLAFIMAGQTRLIREWLTKHPEMPAKEAAETLQRMCYAIMHA